VRKLVTLPPSDLESRHGKLERQVSALWENIPTFNDRRHVQKLFLAGKTAASQRGTITRLQELRQGLCLQADRLDVSAVIFFSANLQFISRYRWKRVRLRILVMDWRLVRILRQQCIDTFQQLRDAVHLGE